MVDLSVRIGEKLTLKNPVMTASGTFGYGFEFCDLLDLGSLGGIIVKGTTLEPREGNPYPRMAETPSGMLNAVGLQNKGVEHFISHIYPEIENLDTAVVVNVSGSAVADYAEVCRRLDPLPGVAALEINISCPNVKQGGMAFGTTTKGAAEVTRAVRSATSKPIILKLSPNVTDIASIAEAVEAEGADAVSLVNTFLGMAIDIDRRQPRLSTITGGLSGPCIKPIALRMVWQTARRVKIPVIGLGGIVSGRDAIEFIMAGASAVEIGTGNFIDPSVAEKAVVEIREWCERQHVASLAEIRGII